MTVRVVAVDDHPIVVEGIMSLIRSQTNDVELVGSAPTWSGLKAVIAALPAPPDIALVDLHLAEEDAYEAIEVLSSSGIRVLLLTSELRAIPIRRAMAAGASGLALKSDPVTDILDVLQQVAAGQEAVSSDLAFALVSDESLVAHLAPREVEVLSLLADGVPRKSVGSRLDPPVALSTVNTYINRACVRYRELGRQISSPRDVIRAATEDGHLDGFTLQ